MQTLHLRLGDSVELLKELEDGSLGAAVLDPPYGLEFMGKGWDAPWKYGMSEHGFTDGADRRPAPTFSSNRNPTCQACGLRQRTWKGGPEACDCDDPAFDDTDHSLSDRQKFQTWCRLWLDEIFRLLPPGGVIKVFGGTRMFHRMAQAMQNAGFEGIGLEAWVYGSGFPKSLNLSKAIDKHAGVKPVASVPASGVGMMNPAVGTGGRAPQREDGGWNETKVRHIMPPTQTEDAKRFEGWGTALKPAWEPFIVGYKPTDTEAE